MLVVFQLLVGLCTIVRVITVVTLLYCYWYGEEKKREADKQKWTNKSGGQRKVADKQSEQTKVDKQKKGSIFSRFAVLLMRRMMCSARLDGFGRSFWAEFGPPRS